MTKMGRLLARSLARLRLLLLLERETDSSHRQADLRGPGGGTDEWSDGDGEKATARRSQLLMRARLLCDALSDKQSDDVGGTEGGREGEMVVGREKIGVAFARAYSTLLS